MAGQRGRPSDWIADSHKEEDGYVQGSTGNLLWVPARSQPAVDFLDAPKPLLTPHILAQTSFLRAKLLDDLLDDSEHSRGGELASRHSLLVLEVGRDVLGRVEVDRAERNLRGRVEERQIEREGEGRQCVGCGREEGGEWRRGREVWEGLKVEEEAVECYVGVVDLELKPERLGDEELI